MDTRTLTPAVIFDLYDTLVADGGRDRRDAVSHAMAGDLGVDPRAFAEAIRSSFDLRARGLLGDLKTTIRTLALGLGVEPDTRAVRRAAERRLELHRSLLEPAPTVLENLDRLRADGYRIGLISDCSDETPRLWPHTPLAARIDAAVFSCVARARKPDPALYRMAAAELGVDPEHCVYIGDGASNELGGAAAVGMTAIQLRHATMSRIDQADRASLYGAVPWHGPAIDNLGQLRGILDSRLADLSTLPTRYFVKWPEPANERATRSTAASVPGIATAYLDCAAAVAPLLHSPRLAERWTEPSALPEFSISALAGHLARAVFNVERFLDAHPVSGEPLDAVTYYLTTSDPAPDPHDPVQLHIRQRGRQAAGAGATDLATRFEAARERLARVLPTLDDNQLVTVFDRHTLPLGQALLTRLVELAVHADDLAVSLALPTPALPDSAADYALDTLTRIARGRHGTANLIRALARRERAPASISAF